MKKLLYSAMMLGIVLGAASCETDRDDNPVLSVQGVTLTLNNPSFSKMDVALCPDTADLNFTWSATGYTLPYVTNYTMTICTTSAFDADHSITVGQSTGGSAAIKTYELNSKLQKMLGWKSADDVPSSVHMYGRVTSEPSEASVHSQYVLTSNVVEFDVVPTFIESKGIQIEFWWMLGGIIADGSWSNSADNKYVGNMSLYPSKDVEYDAEGKGEIYYTGYFPAGDFKILTPAFDWNYGLCAGFQYRNGGDDPGNISVAQAGYYKVTVDTKACSGKMEALDIQPSVYGTIGIVGSFDWNNDREMKKIFTFDGAENHDWYLETDLSAGDQIKFRADKSWDVANWGYGENDGDINTYGDAQQNGKNIGIATAGTYRIVFNDITGSFIIDLLK